MSENKDTPPGDAAGWEAGGYHLTINAGGIQRVWKSNTMVSYFLPPPSAGKRIHVSCCETCSSFTIWRNSIKRCRPWFLLLQSAGQDNDKMIIADNGMPPDSGNVIDNRNALR
jgi:hypothetical protein